MNTEFEVSDANAYTEKKPDGGKLLQFPRQNQDRSRGIEYVPPQKATGHVSSAVTAGCVVICVGTPRWPANGALSVELELDRPTSLLLSDGMLAAIAAGSNGRMSAVASAVRVWDGGGKAYLSTVRIEFHLIGDAKNNHWQFQMHEYGDKGITSAAVQIHFDSANARVLAELLRIMPFQ